MEVEQFLAVIKITKLDFDHKGRNVVAEDIIDGKYIVSIGLFQG